MSSILSRFTRITLTNFTTPRSHHLQHVKWCHDESHYNHGIPGIPTDGKVVLLQNTITGSQVYLIGVRHGTKENTETVKKVINAVRPDVVALELCEKSASELKRWKFGNVDLFRMFLRCMRSSGSLKRKMDTFFRERRFQAKCMRSMEFKVAIEESQKVKARLVLIDQDTDVLCKQFRSLNIIQNIEYQRLDEVDLIDLLKRWLMLRYLPEKTPRANIEGILCWFNLIFPEHFKLQFVERDVLMCTKLRRLEEKIIVAVVGLGHMDGIELTWKYAEDRCW